MYFDAMDFAVMDVDPMISGVTKNRAQGCLVLLLSVCAVWLAGCATDEPAPVEDRSLDSVSPQRTANTSPARAATASGNYRVVQGDTLYSISFKRGLDYRDVAAWNGIAPPYKILVGQELRLSSATAGAASAPAPVARSPAPAPASAPVVASAVSPPASAASAPAAQNSAASNTSMFEDVPSAPAPVQAEEPPPTPAASSTPLPPTPVVAVTPPAAKPAAELPPPPPPARPANDSANVSVNGVVWRWPSAGKVIGGFIAGDQTRQGVDIAGSTGDPVTAAADGEVVYSGNGLIGYGELIIVKHNASFLSAYGHNRKRLVQEGDKVRAGQQIAEMGSSASSRDELHFEIRKNGKPVNPLDYLPAR